MTGWAVRPLVLSHLCCQFFQQLHTGFLLILAFLANQKADPFRVIIAHKRLDLFDPAVLAAKAKQQGFIDEMDDMDKVDTIPEGRIVKIGWCGCPECGHKFEDKYDIKILGTPFKPENITGKCIVCGKEGSKPAYAARTL